MAFEADGIVGNQNVETRQNDVFSNAGHQPFSFCLRIILVSKIMGLDHSI
jgi:hypothetical protein